MENVDPMVGPVARPDRSPANSCPQSSRKGEPTYGPTSVGAMINFKSVEVKAVRTELVCRFFGPATYQD